MNLRRILLVVTMLIILSSCVQTSDKPITLAVNPWPGYEFLYLAEYKGIFKEVGLNLKLKQVASLADVQRAYVNGHVDGLASTMIEAVQAGYVGGKPLEVILIPDYSNGGDIIVSSSDITSIDQLKGKTVGCEVSSLGIFLLQQALAKHDMQLSDINIVNVEQADGEAQMLSRDIDAFVTYPPFSVNLLKHKEFQSIFSSADIPQKIIDTVAFSTEVIQQNPDLVKKIHQAWNLALSYANQNPEESYQIMAERERITSAEFQDVLPGLSLLDIEMQQSIFSEPDKLQSVAVSVCETLVHVKSLVADCSAMPNIVYRGEI